MNNVLDYIKHIPHFHMIRIVESRLLSEYIGKNAFPFLDLGCGDGVFASSLQLHNVYGIDMDEEAINRMKNDGYYSDVRIASASAIPYADGYFGTVFSNCAVEHMDEISKVIDEVKRVLKPSGKFVFTVPTPRFLSVMRDDAILKRKGLSDDQSIVQYNSVHHHVNVHDIKEWQVMLKEAGLKMIRHNYYLPGAIGQFVARMEIFYTIGKPRFDHDIARLDARYMSIFGAPLRLKLHNYIKNPTKCKSGTHLIIEAVKC